MNVMISNGKKSVEMPATLAKAYEEVIATDSRDGKLFRENLPTVKASVANFPPETMITCEGGFKDTRKYAPIRAGDLLAYCNAVEPLVNALSEIPAFEYERTDEKKVKVKKSADVMTADLLKMLA